LQIEDFGLLITFSSYLVFQDEPFWDRRRPRLPCFGKGSSVVTFAGEDACGPRRARPWNM